MGVILYDEVSNDPPLVFFFPPANHYKTMTLKELEKRIKNTGSTEPEKIARIIFKIWRKYVINK